MLLPNERGLIQANFKQAKVLFIEDEIDHWTLIKSVIQRCLPEINPVRAESPDKALTMLTDWCTQEWEIPKMIFQDLYMPNSEDGWNLLKAIKAMDGPCNRIPVVILSSSSNRADIEKAYRLGSTSYLIKPTSSDQWLAYFQELRTYWWETVTLPPMQFRL